MFGLLFFGDGEGGGGLAVSGFGVETLTRVVINVPEFSASDLVAALRTSQDANLSIRALSDFVRSLAGGLRVGRLELAKNAARALATLTISSTGPANDETFTVCGVVFTAKSSGAAGNQFNTSATPSVVAANIAAAVNASASTRVAQAVLASAAGDVVTFAARVPGAEANGFVLASGLANTVAVDFEGGSNGSLVNYGINQAAA